VRFAANCKRNYSGHTLKVALNVSSNFLTPLMSLLKFCLLLRWKVTSAGFFVPSRNWASFLKKLLTIRAADSEGRRSSAHVLVSRMYARRGYDTSPLAEPQPGRVTLIGEDHDVARGTITIGFNGAQPLLADECFADVLGGLRRQGLVLCEFIKLAIDGVGRSRHVLASLFHSAFLYAHEVPPEGAIRCLPTPTRRLPSFRPTCSA